MPILRAFRDCNPADIARKPQFRTPANSLSLASSHHPVRDYYAFCDRDDVCKAAKLARTIAILKRAPAARAAPYGTGTTVTGASGSQTRLSPMFLRKLMFHRALVQSGACGNRPSTDVPQ